MMLKPLDNDEIDSKGKGPGGFFEPFYQGK